MEPEVLTNFSSAVPREPQEVHSWYQDGFRRSQEAQGQERLDYASRETNPTCHTLTFSLCASNSYLKESTVRILLAFVICRLLILSFSLFEQA